MKYIFWKRFLSFTLAVVMIFGIMSNNITIVSASDGNYLILGITPMDAVYQLGDTPVLTALTTTDVEEVMFKIGSKTLTVSNYSKFNGQHLFVSTAWKMQEAGDMAIECYPVVNDVPYYTGGVETSLRVETFPLTLESESDSDYRVLSITPMDAIYQLGDTPVLTALTTTDVEEVMFKIGDKTLIVSKYSDFHGQQHLFVSNAWEMEETGDMTIECYPVVNDVPYDTGGVETSLRVETFPTMLESENGEGGLRVLSIMPMNGVYIKNDKPIILAITTADVDEVWFYIDEDDNPRKRTVYQNYYGLRLFISDPWEMGYAGEKIIKCYPVVNDEPVISGGLTTPLRADTYSLLFESVGEVLENASDVKEYTFTLPKNGEVIVSLTREIGSYSYHYVEVRDSKDNIVSSFNIDIKSVVGISAPMMLAQDTYTVKVTSSSNNFTYGNKYTLSVQFAENNGGNEAEPNDTKEKSAMNEANKIQPNSSISGYLLNAEDTDFFTFELPRNGEVIVSLTREIGSYSYHYVEVRDSKDNIVSSFNIDIKGVVGISAPMMLAQDTYTVKVTSSSNNFTYGNKYTLSVQFAENNGGNEAEPNDTKEKSAMNEANKIQPNSSISGYLLNAEDTDFFTFELPKNGEVIVSLTREIGSYSYHYVEVRDSKDNIVSSFNIDIKGVVGISAPMMLAQDTYTVKVTSSSINFTAGNKYTLSVRFAENNGGNEAEPNDTKEDANEFQPNSSISGYLLNAKDTDFFTFELPKSGEAIVSLTREIGSGSRHYVEVRNSKDNIVASFNTGYGVIGISAPMILKQDIYTVKVTGDSYNFTAGNKYTLSVQFVAHNIIKGKFIHSDAFTTTNLMSDFYYSDEFFHRDAYEYHQDTATMSLCLAMSAFGKAGVSYENDSDNLAYLLDKIKFEDFDTNEWFKKPSITDSIAVGIANKKFPTQNFTVLAVAVRGGKYFNEWGGNFKIGNGNYHEGFLLARDEVLAYIKEYIAKFSISGNIKIWITGFSRGGAVANLIAGALVDGALSDVGNVNLTPKNIFAYTFEAPAGVRTSLKPHDKKYDNIYNILNFNDIVTKVAFSAWNYTRYGVDWYLPDPTNKKGYEKYFDEMIKNYKFDVCSTESNEITGTKQYEYKIADYTRKWGKDSQGIFLNDLLNELFSDKYIGQEYWLSDVQQGTVDFMPIFLGDNGIDPKVLMSRIGELVFQYFSDNIAGKDIGEILKELDKHKFNICVYIYRALHEFNVQKGYKPDDIYIMLDGLLIRVLDYMLYNPVFLRNTLSDNFNKTFLDGLMEAHYPELCYAWMNTLNESESEVELLSNGLYRNVYINCPVDVDVFDSTGKLVAQIISDIPQELENSSIISFVDENDQKGVYLPADENYTIKLKATGNGELNYSVQEVHPELGTISMVNYFNIPIIKGNTLEGTVDNLEVVENGVYPLKINNSDLVPSDDLKDDKIAYYTTTVEIQGNGYVAGDLTSKRGEFIKLTAYPDDGNEFLGWYKNDIKISSEISYRFCVLEDTTIEARFAELKTEVIKGDLNGDGKVDIEDAKFYLESLVGNKILTPTQELALKGIVNENDSAIKKLRAFLNFLK